MRPDSVVMYNTADEEVVEVYAFLMTSCVECGEPLAPYREVIVMKTGRQYNISPRFVCVNGHPQEAEGEE